MGKRVVLSVGDKKRHAYKEQYCAARQQNVANNFSLLWGKPVSQLCVGDTLREKKKWENKTCKNMRRLKGAKLEEHAWMEQVNVKNVTEMDEVVKELVKVIGQQMVVTNFVYKNWYVFCSKKMRLCHR
jgi:hypothetical protein